PRAPVETGKRGRHLRQAHRLRIRALAARGVWREMRGRQLDLDREDGRGITCRVLPANDREHALEVFAVLASNPPGDIVVLEIPIAVEQEAALRDVHDPVFWMMRILADAAGERPRGRRG